MELHAVNKIKDRCVCVRVLTWTAYNHPPLSFPLSAARFSSVCAEEERPTLAA